MGDDAGIARAAWIARNAALASDGGMNTVGGDNPNGRIFVGGRGTDDGGRDFTRAAWRCAGQ